MDQSDHISKKNKICVVGSEKLACSVSVCLAQAQESVSLLTDSLIDCKKWIDTHIRDINRMTDWKKGKDIQITNDWTDPQDISLAIVINEDNLSSKLDLIGKLESSFSKDLIIAISTDHIPLRQLQKEALRPENILVMNWVEPAHTTFFLELVHNEVTNKKHILGLNHQARTYWKKDPYTIKDELGIRSRMMAAMIREALYLVQNGYATVEDIDRACRNDAGTYMPFAGNFRYMDLMGTYAYGVVMEELNKELSTKNELFDFFINKINNEKQGMKNQEGFYSYKAGDIKKWYEKVRTFSYKIRDLMDRYPFNESLMTEEE